MPTLVYVIDTSSLIDLKPYPKDLFPTLWTNLGALMAARRMISTKMVLQELEKYAVRDDITRWARKNKRAFVNIDGDQLRNVKRILAEFPGWVDADQERNTADPFLVALAMTKDPRPSLELIDSKRIVVSEEKFKDNKINIPSVCLKYQIECIDHFEMFRREGWKF
jgi:hypothetical protein